MRRAASAIALGFVLWAAVAQAGEAAAPAKVVTEPGEGFTVTSADGRYALQARARVQARVTESWSARDGRVDDFMIRRMRLQLRGHLYDTKIAYGLQVGFATSDLDPVAPAPLRDAYVTFKHLRDAHLRVGQMKVPFDRQRVNSSSALQFPDRAAATQEFNLDRDVGLQLYSTDLFGLGGVLGYQLGVFGGDGRNRNGTTPGVLGVARLELTPFGTFDDDEEADLARRADPKLAVGLGAAINSNTDRARSTIGDAYAFARFTYLHAELDTTFKWHGFSLSAALHWRQADRDFVDGSAVSGAPAREFSRSGLGWFAEAGWMFTEHWEAVARAGDVLPAPGADPRFRRNRQYGGGVNWYGAGHDVKVQTDAFWIAGDDLAAGRVEVRSQLQLFF